jgi:hypothetical protein
MFSNGKEIVGEVLNRRREATHKRLEKIRQKLELTRSLCADHGCVYATGSYGRVEASRYSDLDLFILSREIQNDATQKPRREPSLSNLKQILIKADLIRATQELGIEEFSGDGEYLTHYTVEDLKRTLGTREDDVTNTFTARLLLLIESSPLIGESAYEQLTRSVIDAYWKDYAGKESVFMPSFLVNDILRMWRTFCVNYEAGKPPESDEDRAKRKLKNYKLKHSRMLSCYSALMFLLFAYKDAGTVSPDTALEMVSLTPTQRLEWLLGKSECKAAHADVEKIIATYEGFLQQTDAPKDDLVNKFKGDTKQFFEGARSFGNSVFSVLQTLGADNALYRVIVV